MRQVSTRFVGVVGRGVCRKMMAKEHLAVVSLVQNLEVAGIRSVVAAGLARHRLAIPCHIRSAYDE